MLARSTPHQNGIFTLGARSVDRATTGTPLNNICHALEVMPCFSRVVGFPLIRRQTLADILSVRVRGHHAQTHLSKGTRRTTRQKASASNTGSGSYASRSTRTAKSDLGLIRGSNNPLFLHHNLIGGSSNTRDSSLRRLTFSSQRRASLNSGSLDAALIQNLLIRSNSRSRSGSSSSSLSRSSLLSGRSLRCGSNLLLITNLRRRRFLRRSYLLIGRLLSRRSRNRSRLLRLTRDLVVSG